MNTSGRLNILLATGLLAGCPDLDALPSSLAPPTLRVTIDAPEVIVVEGQSIAIRVLVQLPDGTPASGGYRFTPFATCCTLTPQTVGQGEESLIFSRPVPGETTLIGKITLDDGGFVFGREHTVIFLDGVPEGVQAVSAEATMAPGERRPFAGLVYEQSVGLPTPPTYTTSDPLVATVDDDGVVTAIAPGTTSLVLAGAGFSTSVSLVVDTQRTIGPPPEGAFSLQRTEGPNLRFLPTQAAENADHGLVVDSRGYPHAVLKFAQRTVVASWSGTDIGTELLPDAFDTKANAYIAIDERDRLYVVTISFRGAFLYEKDALDPQSRWTRRELDTHLASAEHAGLGWGRYYEGSHASASLLPRAGGGLHVAYRVDVNTQTGRFPFDCGAVYRFADVGDDAIATTDITADWYGRNPNGGCNNDLIGHVQQFVLAREADGTTTFVLPFGNRLRTSPETLNAGIGLFKQDANGRWSRPPEPDRVFGQPVSQPLYIQALHFDADETGRVPPSQVFTFELERNAANVFFFDDNGRITSGQRVVGAIGTAWISTPEFPEDEAASLLVAGLATRAGRLHFFVATQDLLFLNRVMPPASARPSDAEVDGRLASDAVNNVFAPQVVGPDGTRFSIRSPLDGPPTLQRSDQTDAPWSTANTTLLNPDAPVAVAGDAIYVFDEAQRLRESTDRGETLRIVSGVLAGQGREAERMVVATGAGAAVLFPNDLVVSTFGADGEPSPFTRLGLPGSLRGRVVRTDPSQRGLFALDDGFAFVAATGFASTPEQLLVVEFGWDGIQRATRDLASDTATRFDSLLPGDGALASDGTLVFASHRSEFNEARARTHRVDLVTGEWTTVEVAQATSRPTNIVSLVRGGFVMGGSIDRRSLAPDDEGGLFHQTRAVLWRSTDGLAWETPVVLRPFGGDAQEVRRLFDDGGGGALALIDDTFSMNRQLRDPVRLVQHVELP